MRILFLLITIFIFDFNYAQQKQVDSLIHCTLAKGNHDSTKLNIYLKICDLCNIKDNLKYAAPSLKIVNQLILNSKNLKEKNSFLIKKNQILDYYYSYFLEYNSKAEQLQCLFKKLYVFKELRDSIAMALSYRKIALHYKNIGNIKKELEFYKEGLNLGNKLGNSDIIFSFNGSIRDLYIELGDTALAIKYIQDILALRLGKNDNHLLAMNYLKIGKCYTELNDTINAMKYYSKAIKLNKQESDFKSLIGVYLSISDMYLRHGKFNKALNICLENLSLTEKQSDKHTLAMLLYNTGAAYSKLKNYNYAIKKYETTLMLAEKNNLNNLKISCYKKLAENFLFIGNINSANFYMLKYFNDIQKNNSIDQLQDAELLHSKIDSAKNNYKEAYTHFKNYIFFINEKNKVDLIRNTYRERFKDEQEKEKLELKLKQEKKDAVTKKEIEVQKTLRNSFLGGFTLMFLFAGISYRNYKRKKKDNHIIASQKLEVEKQKVLVEEQNHVIKEKQKEIVDSITYAKRLQHAILTPTAFINTNFLESFILYKPKDIVAGDFYWAEKVGEKFFIAAADSTGHGVPGAMVSVVCSNALNRTVNEFGITDTGKILDKTRELVIQTFEKSNEEVKDGMDISLLCIDSNNKNVFWSGANNPLWYIQNNELKEIKANKQPIGKTDHPKPFTAHQIEYNENTTFYLFTDGFADQFGGPNGKKFKYKQFEELLISINNETMLEQSSYIDKKFEEWKGTHEQVDDVCIIGIKI